MQRRQFFEVENIDQTELKKNVESKTEARFGLSLIHSLSSSNPLTVNFITELQKGFIDCFKEEFIEQQRVHGTIIPIISSKTTAAIYHESEQKRKILISKLKEQQSLKDLKSDSDVQSYKQVKSTKNQSEIEKLQASDKVTLYRALNSISSFLKYEPKFIFNRIKICKNGDVVLILTLDHDEKNKLSKTRQKLNAAGAEQKYNAEVMQHDLFIVIGYFNKLFQLNKLDSLNQILEKITSQDFFSVDNLQLVEFTNRTLAYKDCKDLTFFRYEQHIQVEEAVILEPRMDSKQL